MREFDKFNDAVVDEEWEKAFRHARTILNRKVSKRLIHKWINHCLDCLEEMNKTLPDKFYEYSLYKQREILNKI